MQHIIFDRVSELTPRSGGGSNAWGRAKKKQLSAPIIISVPPQSVNTRISGLIEYMNQKSKLLLLGAMVAAVAYRLFGTVTNDAPGESEIEEPPENQPSGA